jgi:hypothetical protein
MGRARNYAASMIGSPAPFRARVAGARPAGARAAEGRPLKNRLIGGLGVLWGAFLLSHAFQQRGHESLGVAGALSLVLAAAFVIIGLYYVFKGPERPKVNP